MSNLLRDFRFSCGTGEDSSLVGYDRMYAGKDVKSFGEACCLILQASPRKANMFFDYPEDGG
jgi:hypothetical protein